MKWLLAALGILVVFAIVVMVIGRRLPQRHRASVTIHLSQPAATVWGVVRDLGSWPSWNEAIESAERLDDVDGNPVWLVADSNGRIPSEILESTAPADGHPGRLVTRIADPTLPFGGSWTWEVTPAEEGCAVRVTENGEIYNAFFRFMARFVFGYTGTAERYLRALGSSFGESVAPLSEVKR